MSQPRAKYTEAWYYEQVAKKHAKVQGGVENTTTSKRRYAGDGARREASHHLPRYTEAQGSGELTCKQMPVSNPAPAPMILTLHGQLPSGKNQVQLLFRKGKVHKYPNKTFTNWRADVLFQVLEQWESTQPPIDVPVRLTVEYWPGDKRTRDVSGQLDALFHLLVYAKVLKDDGLIHELGGWKRHLVNRKLPKSILTIEVL